MILMTHGAAYFGNTSKLYPRKCSMVFLRPYIFDDQIFITKIYYTLFCFQIVTFSWDQKSGDYLSKCDCLGSMWLFGYLEDFAIINEKGLLLQ